jgi:hypothetical protein
MKFLILLPIVFLSLPFNSTHLYDSTGFVIAPDTTSHHVLDGKLTEWPVQNFQTDLSTEIKYAMDNDNQNLYLALAIPNSRMQIKLMHQGMEMYIDLKAKKKEGKGIEFPLKKNVQADDAIMTFNSENTNDAIEHSTPEQRKAKLKTMRASLALSLTTMRLFGFEGHKSEEQGLVMPGSANIAFAWDSADVMCIEYRIPLSLVETSSSLSQKEVSIGWKINGFQRPTPSGESETADENHHRDGYGGGGQRNAQAYAPDQSFWGKYVFK